jgi:hypothetical protein
VARKIRELDRAIVSRPIGSSSRRSPGRKLAKLARRYVWWLPLADVVRDPDRLIRQILALGLPEDYLFIEHHFGRRRIIAALRSALPGSIDARSWTFWHRQFQLPVPSLPKRRIPGVEP